MSDKPRMVIVTDPSEISMIRLEHRTGALHLPRGGFLDDGTCIAYASDMEKWRARLAASPSASLP